MGKLAPMIEETIHGLLSGYPLCCVLDFVHTCYTRGHRLVAVQRWREFGLVHNGKSPFRVLASPGYVPCRLCMAKIIVGEAKPVSSERQEYMDSNPTVLHRLWQRSLDWRYRDYEGERPTMPSPIMEAYHV